jgi:WD40 repeat protein
MSSALKVNWLYGFSKDLINGVQSLTHRDRNALFFLSSHSGVIYDFEHRTQVVLQGHCNQITCCSVSSDKRWIVTGDAGDDSILVVWDSLTGTPVKTIFSPHRNGVVAVDISEDASYIATLGAADAVRQIEFYCRESALVIPNIFADTSPHHFLRQTKTGATPRAGDMGVDARG